MYESIIRCVKRLLYRFWYILVIIYGFIVLSYNLRNYKLQRKEINDDDDSVLVKQIINNLRLDYTKMYEQESNIHITMNAIPLNSSQYGVIMIENIVGEDSNVTRQRFIPPENIG
ncbi:hypothetical protein WUBG_13519 [Wuchereria bancrofti]|uniref:Uncharacterized protein n=1 Tax=Wuchereria bancrofti TaxID=6293 RepID=J9E0D9_WUCBA|nr:hypothetical protein WUBG_13519 [Wuchereria bancrofti]